MNKILLGANGKALVSEDGKVLTAPTSGGGSGGGSKLYEHIINMPVGGLVDGSAGSKTLTFKFLLTNDTQITLEQLITELNNTINSVPEFNNKKINFENGYILITYYGSLSVNIYVEGIDSENDLIYYSISPVSSNTFGQGGFTITTFSSYVVNEISDTFKLNIG